MSATESDCDDEDLSAPPKTANKSKSVSSATNTNSLNASKDGEDTVDEEGETAAQSQCRSSLKRKRESVAPAIPVYTAHRRETHDGNYST
jgi:hypothetical protein